MSLGWIGVRSGQPWWDVHGRTTRRRRRRLAIASLLAVVIVEIGMLAAARPAAAAGTTVNLDQWASSDRAWQNGNLNGNNSRYPEGGVVPFRLALEGLAAGAHEITIQYDFTAGGHKAYDFLTTWSAWASPSLCGPAGGAISSRCPSLGTADTEAFPTDPFVADGLAVSAAQVYSGAPRRLTLYGGTIDSISLARHDGSVAGNSTAEHVVRFRTTGSAALLVWGGHLAQSAFWDRSAGGPSDGAGQVSGAPWHMRTLRLDGSGAKNQDRSIQPSAIVGELPPGALAPPTPTPAAPAPPAAAPPAVVASPTAGIPAPAGPTGPAPGPAGVTPPPTTTGTPGLALAEGTGLISMIIVSLITAVAVVLLVRLRIPRRR